MSGGGTPRAVAGLPSGVSLILLLGALSAFGPLSIDMYLAGLPELADDLGAAPSVAQLTLTACLLGLAAGQIVGGSTSDARGRRGPLLVGLSIYVVASALCAVAPSIWALIVLRFVQGFAGAFGIVIGRATVRDLRQGREAAAMFAGLMAVNSVAPILAPVIGAGVLEVTTWRGIFLVLSAFGAALLAICALRLGETLPPPVRRAGGLGETLRTFRRLLGERRFSGCALAFGLSLGGMFAYIAGSPFVLQDVYGVSPVVFSLLFGLNGVGILLMGRLSHRLSRRHDPAPLLGAGLVVAACGALGLLAGVLSGLGLPVVLPSLFVLVSCVGIIVPNGTALALAGHPNTAGAASGLLGLSQYALGAAMAPLVGLAGRDTAVPMAVVISVAALSALVIFHVAVRPSPSPATPS